MYRFYKKKGGKVKYDKNVKIINLELRLIFFLLLHDMNLWMYNNMKFQVHIMRQSSLYIGIDDLHILNEKWIWSALI